MTEYNKVTILVFLAALVQQNESKQEDHQKIRVTILVFLAALVQPIWYHPNIQRIHRRYNPCFSGSSSATRSALRIYPHMGRGYNPCFSGSSSATDPIYL